MTNKQIISWLAAVLWMGLIFWLSHQPGGESSGLSLVITERIFSIISVVIPAGWLDFEFFHTLVRKGAHLFAYFTLGVLLMNALGRSGITGMGRLLIAFGISVLYAISDEIHQLFIPGRSGELADVFIDSAGAAVGIGLYMIVSKLKPLLPNKTTRKGANP
jgi:VanZ family protein